MWDCASTVARRTSQLAACLVPIKSAPLEPADFSRDHALHNTFILSLLTLPRASRTEHMSLIQRISRSLMSLRLPGRKQVPVGTDLEGNLYYEMPNPNNPR